MKIREYLGQIRVLTVKIEQRRAQAAELRDQAESLMAMELKPDVVQTSKPASAMEEKVVKYLDLEQEILELTDQLEGARQRIITDIHSLDDERYINVLYKRYVEGKRMTAISREMNYAYVYTSRLCVRAEEALGRRLNYVK